jgi:hypothetical protein
MVISYPKPYLLNGFGAGADSVRMRIWRGLFWMSKIVWSRFGNRLNLSDVTCACNQYNIELAMQGTIIQQSLNDLS